MTGRDLIVYILNNNLENEEVFKDGIFFGLIDENEVAIKFDVGVATVKAWYDLNMIKGIKIGDSIFFLKDVDDPRKKTIEINTNENS